MKKWDKITKTDLLPWSLHGYSSTEIAALYGVTKVQVQSKLREREAPSRWTHARFFTHDDYTYLRDFLTSLLVPSNGQSGAHVVTREERRQVRELRQMIDYVLKDAA